jgi:WD40 repeat protein
MTPLRLAPLPLAGAAALAAATLALLACTSNPPASPAPTPEATQTPEASHTPEPPPPPSPTILGADPTSKADPYATPPRPPLRTFGSWVIDAATGTAAQLGGDANSFLSLRDSFHPSFTPDGTAVWLSRSDWTDARRYALDGTLTDTIEGAWAVIESPDGRARAYYLREEDGRTSDLVAERDGASHRIEGRHALPAFSPASRSLAYYSIGGDNVATLDVLDLDSGAIRTLAEDVNPCACDLTPHPAWSPSGTRLAYYDFEGNDDTPWGGATFLVDLATGATKRVVDYAPPGFAAGWLAGDANGDRLILEDYALRKVSILDTTTGGALMAFEGTVERLSVVRVVAPSFVEVSSVIPGDDPVLVTRLYDGVTGDLLARWDYEGRATMTPSGPALAVDSSALDAGGCDGTLIIHSALDEPACLEGIDEVAWSPDGTRLATRSRQDDGQHIGLWDPTTGHRKLVVLPSVAMLIGWNPQGTHLLVSDISGL